jgi:hypothetical protein
MNTADTTIVVMSGLLWQRRAGANQAARRANDAAEARRAEGVSSHGEGTKQDLEQHGPNGEERCNVLLPA